MTPALADLKRYLEAGKNGRRVPLSEIKELSPEERKDLLNELAKLSEEELKQ